MAVTSGKGGVGKTSVVVNLAVALAERGHRVSLLDGDHSLGNVDIFLGLEAEGTLEHVLRGTRRLEEVMLAGPGGVRVVPASNGVPDLTRLSREQAARLRSVLAELGSRSDFVLVDTATGISDNVVSWLRCADEVLVVTAPDPAAVVDAYAVLKLLARIDPGRTLSLLVNHARDEEEALAIHERLAVAVREFLSAELVSYGWVQRDPLLQESVRRRTPIVTLLPESPSSSCFRALAERVLASNHPHHIEAGERTELAGQVR